jgi:hypothetical protein
MTKRGISRGARETANIEAGTFTKSKTHAGERKASESIPERHAKGPTGWTN